MRLHRWCICENRLNGYVVGSDRYEDDTFIETSEIVTAAYDGEDFLIRTANSVYECTADEFEGTEEELSDFLLELSKQEQKDQTRKLPKQKK